MSCTSTSPRSITYITTRRRLSFWLQRDIYDNPTGYLNGSAPANVTGFVHHCNLTGQACVDEDGGKSPDSSLWYDELHLRYVDWHFRSAWKFCGNADPS